MLEYKGRLMKKIALIFLIIIAIVSCVAYLYLNNVAITNRANRENNGYVSYYNKEITGAEVATLINKAIDNNQTNQVEKNSKGIYIENEDNSINIEIKFIDNDETYNMETIFNSGTDTFMKYYNSIKFKCTKIGYHQKTKKVKYMYIEQIST